MSEAPAATSAGPVDHVDEFVCPSGQKQAVGRLQIWAPNLSAEDRHLMTKSQELEVALRVSLAAEHGDADRQANQHIDRREEHDAGQ